MSDDLPYKAEYAKSARASCKACKGKISKDSLRVAKMVQSRHFDGKVPNWFHFSCFFMKSKAVSAEEMSGLGVLRWEDQEKMKDKLVGAETHGAGSSMAESVSSELKVEYAKSNRSKCKGCQEQINKDEIRLAKFMEPGPDSNAPAGIGPIPWWHHIQCFIESRDELGIESSVTAESFAGFKQLKKEDQKLLQEKLGTAGGKKVSKGKKRKVQTDDTEKQKKKVKKTAEEEREEELLKEQSKFLWKIRDELRKSCSLPQIREMLEDNLQPSNGGESNVLDRCVEGMAFGRLVPCTECNGGSLAFRGDAYHCTGNLTGWTKCQCSTKEPSSEKWSISKGLKEDVEYLKKFKFKKRNRIFPKLTALSLPKSPDASAKPERTTTDAAAKSPGTTTVVSAAGCTSGNKPLSEMKFVIIGKCKQSKEGIVKAVDDLGGAVVDKVNSSITCCISTQAEVNRDHKTKKMKDAEKYDIPVVSEDYLDAVKNGGAMMMISQHSIASWGQKKGSSVVDAPPPTKLKTKKRASTAPADGRGIKEKRVKVSVKGAAAVDPDSGMEHKCHVLQEKGLVYNETLGLVDVSRGTNSYYKLQILERDGSSRCQLFRSWGRVGTTIGGNKLESCGSKANAIDKFCELYAEKTGNEWSDHDNFVKHPNRFYPLEIDYGQDEEDFKKVAVAPGSRSELPKPIQELIKMIFDIESMKKTMVEFEIDLKKMPLGKLTKRQIENAYAVLGEAQRLISSEGSATSLLDASNRFYTLIPHDFGMKKPPLLDNIELIQTKVGMLDSLLDIEVAYSLLKSGQTDENKDPLDINYEKLQTDLEVLEQDSNEFDIVQQYVKNTHASTHGQYDLNIQEVFKVNRHGEGARFKPFKELPNRKLLWHGSHTTNYAGILSQGLRIAPPEAPVTGYMFGKGVYFADMVSKSANYCRTTPSNNIGVLLLCEVALGNIHELTDARYIEKLPKGKHSVKGCGRTGPDSACDVTLDDGTVVPLGKGVDTKRERSSLLYNEYIVYDVAQINVKYLLQLEFKYKYGW